MTTEKYSSKDGPVAPKFVEETIAAEGAQWYAHVYGKDAKGRDVVCETDTRGYATPANRSRTELVVDASEGVIPLWGSDVTLRWRFQPQSMTAFVDPVAAKQYLRGLFGEALLLWDDAVPLRFTEAQDGWDFEIAISPTEKCNLNGCTLASAFFPDPGRHDLKIYRTMFDQGIGEQIETMAHELGHVFGLRHFFAPLLESGWASEIFGEHEPQSIMNYGADSVMTEKDRSDLRLLYELARTGALTDVNGTPIHLVRPFSELRFPGANPVCTPVAAAGRVAR